MPKVKKLTEILANKIAAGEVVERPASAVKELCENSIDAKSGRIIVEIENGGKNLIRVSDDGIGMSAEDAKLAVERYATSKIYNEDDLFFIKTLGFRGEALPSIASVSKFTLITREQDKPFGFKISIEGGVIKDACETGAPIGTTIEAKDLFFNIPARKKFLKTTDTETGHIADTITSFALGYYDKSFLFIHNKKEIKNFPSSTTQIERVKDILKITNSEDLYQIKTDSPDASVTGWAASPDYYKTGSKGIYLFVNGRFIKNRKINYAIFQGYRGRLMKGNFPIAVIFIKVPFQQVDVNVHPAKQEVKFLREKQVMSAVSEAVNAALKEGEKILISKYQNINANQNPTIDAPSFEKKTTQKYQREKQSFLYSANDYTSEDIDYVKRQNELSEPRAYYGKTAQKNIIPNAEKHPDIKIIGQFLKTYIICEKVDEIILIDQHAAHERILFEKLKNKEKTSATASQRLLIPEILETGLAEAETIKSLMPDMLKIGLEIEPFGKNTFAVKAIPAFLSEKQTAPIILDIAEQLIEKGSGKQIENVLDSTLILIACHGAIKANKELSETEMKAIIFELFKCESPLKCPHGRPTLIKMTKKEVEKLFKRIN
ncbi:MAG: DNA mismatch repair endonuclease MutL [Deltaproteobacteria bacterium]|nr:DNA mismatch repair endonuclease MutL [Deltaproteobacteria bacterium]